MSDAPSPSADRQPESSPGLADIRLASLVHIMRSRWSLFSRLGVLEVDSGTLSLYNGEGQTLFSIPVGRAQAQHQRRLFAIHPVFFRIGADDRWWYLVAHAPNKYERRSTRQLVERYRIHEPAPRPDAMTEETYLRLTKNPIGHQVLWKGFWLGVLRATDG